MYSTKPFLSFFICLVIYSTVHSSHSLPASHIIHKRTVRASGTFLLRINGTHVFEFPGSGSRFLKATRTRVENKLADLRARFCQQEEPSSKPPEQSFWKKSLHKLRPIIDPITAMRESVWESLRGLSSKIYNKIRALWKPETRTFHHESPDGETGKLIQKLLEDHPNLKKTAPQFYKNLDPSIRQLLDTSQHFRDELSKDDELIVKRNENIKTAIQEILHLKSDENLDPVEIIGNNMAHYHSEIFKTYQNILQDCLPEKQKYLSKIIGFMGPNNVFEPLIKLGFSEYFKQEAVAYHNSSHILKSIWKEMWDMKLKFAEVIKYKIFSDLSHAAEDSLVVLDYQKFLEDIDSQESYLLCLFGGHEKLERAIEMVEHTNLYQRFAQELKSPSSPIGYQLQFVQSSELHLLYSQDIPEQYIIYEHGISKEKRDSIIIQIKHEGDISLDNIKHRIEFSAKLREERQKILNILNLKDYKNIVQYVNKKSQVKKL